MYLETKLNVVYLIFQKLLIYPKINKLKSFEKSVISIFLKVYHLNNCLRAAIIPNKNI